MKREKKGGPGPSESEKRDWIGHGGGRHGRRSKRGITATGRKHALAADSLRSAQGHSAVRLKALRTAV